MFPPALLLQLHHVCLDDPAMAQTQTGISNTSNAKSLTKQHKQHTLPLNCFVLIKHTIIAAKWSVVEEVQML